MKALAAEGLFLHASSVAVEGRAVLFLGHSTAGKSTIARLLGNTFPVLADDSVFASRETDGKWRVVDGGFRFGRDEVSRWPEMIRRRFKESGAVPVVACLRIHKAENVRLETMEPLELARYLMDAAMEIDLQRKYGHGSEAGKIKPVGFENIMKIRRQWFFLVAEMARSIPGGHLWFPKDGCSAELCSSLAALAVTHAEALRTD